jgi:hypothetical protein
MPAVGHVVKHFKLKVGTTAYECAMTQLDTATEAEETTIRTACPDGTATDYGAPEETVTLAFNIDHAADSLYSYLRANIGKEAAIEYVSPDEKAVYTGTVVVGPPTASAPVGSVETGTCDLKVKGGLLTRADYTPPAP